MDRKRGRGRERERGRGRRREGRGAHPLDRDAFMQQVDLHSQTFDLLLQCARASVVCRLGHTHEPQPAKQGLL